MGATGSAAVAAAFLAACGGSSDSGGDGASGSGLLSKAEDTSSKAVRGGVMKDRTYADPSSMDVQSPIAPLNNVARHVYSTLVSAKPGYLSLIHI